METWLFLIIALSTSIIHARADGGREPTLSRQKREWIIPPKNLTENVDYTHQEYIAWIRSDAWPTMHYSLKGPGADQEPSGLFSVDQENGKVKIHGILDREKCGFYHLTGRARYAYSTDLAEKDIDLRIIVVDQNDNPPVFSIHPIGYVEELSEAGTYVINITATDADDPTTIHTVIQYRIVQQTPHGQQMFNIESKSGRILVRMNTLDREVQETYKLIITGTDMNGESGPNTLTGTGMVTINLLDVNDNVPVLEKNSYECSVKENTMNVEVIRLKCTDADQIHTENWKAVYTIVSGNEAGYFNITTDPVTNEGILIITKEVDYEQLKLVNLNVKVSNKAAFHRSVRITEQKIYPIKVNIQNEPEPPHFRPSTKVITLSENIATINLQKVITTYTATDSDTLQTATNVRYLKWEDKDNWFKIDEKTAEIRLVKYPDRESKFLINGTYYATIICSTLDYPSKTSTGTIAIQVEDFNDHCPELTSSKLSLCYGKNVVYVTATDGDTFPNAEPFEFKVLGTTTEKWNVERINDTTVLLRSQDILWPGDYTVMLTVQDQQGKFCGEQMLRVSVCMCTEAEICKPQRQSDQHVVFGAAGILAMLLGILLLLLVPLLLLFCGCGVNSGDFQAFPFSHKEQLIVYNTEGQGEDNKEIMLLPHIKLGHQEALGAVKGNAGWETRNQWDEVGWCSVDDILMGGSEATKKRHSEFWNLQTFDGMALSEVFLNSYYSTKASLLTDQEFAFDTNLMYENEGKDSLSGSLEDICGELDKEDNLEFLNDLGPQFKTLAKLCKGSLFYSEEKSVSQPSKKISASSKVEMKSSSGEKHSDVMASTSTVVSESTSASIASTAVNTAASTTAASTTHITTADYGQSASSCSGSGGSQTLLLQQPAVYLSSAPVYLMEQQQPTLLLATGQVMGIQEGNMLLLDQTNVTLGAPNTMSRLAHTKVMVEQPPARVGGTMVLGVSEAQAGSGSIQRVQPVQVVHSSSSVSESHMEKTSGQSAGKVGIPSKLTVPRQDKSQFTTGSHHTMREERISVVEKSFQSS